MNINEEEIINSLAYQEFMKENTGEGYLQIRAYGANEAIPIEGIEVTVSTTIGDNEVIFFSGKTDESGMIEKIKLPAPKEGEDNLIAPKKTVYSINAKYQDINENFKVNLYDKICVQEIINIIPQSPIRGYNYGR